MSEGDKKWFETNYVDILPFIIDSRRCDEKAKETSLDVASFEQDIHKLILSHVEANQNISSFDELTN